MEFAKENSLVTLYGYDKNTKEFTHSFEYWWVNGTGIAADSTLVQPFDENKDGYTQVFDGDSWSYKENNLGKIIYNTETKEPKVVDYIGEIQEGWTLLKPKNFDSWNGEAWSDQRTEQEKYDTYLSSLKPLSRRQFKLALLENNLLDTVETKINQIEDAKQKAIIQIEYTEATEFVRTSDSVKYMCSLLGLTEEQVNQMWEAAQQY